MLLTVADHPIPVNIKRQKRKSLTIQVKDGQIFVMAPLLMREETIVGFLLKKKRWIYNRITQVSACRKSMMKKDIIFSLE
jgi:predicted metal-dependent hydrolase